MKGLIAKWERTGLLDKLTEKEKLVKALEWEKLAKEILDYSAKYTH